MQNYLRLGQKLTKLSINGLPLSSFSIVIPSCGGFKGPSLAPEYVKKAARVLQDYLYRLTEIRLPIYMDSYPVRTEGNLYVGSEESFKDDEYRYEIKGQNAFFEGGKRGILYGVYEFLEKHLGLRFYSAEVERFLYAPRIDLGDLKEHYCPIFEYRELCDPNAWDPDFSVKCKLNGSFVRKLREEDGGSVGFAGGFDGLVHTFSKLVKPSLYFDSHPELYAFDGEKRTPNGLCLTSGATLEVIEKEALKWLEAEENPTLLSISINDAFMTYCRCENCQKKLNGGYNDTDLYLEFVNKVSRKIHETYPTVKVEALIYHEMVALPKIVRPDEDIVIRFCPPAIRKMGMEEAGELYLKTKDPLLESSYLTVKTIKEWAKMTETMYIWDYPYNYFSSNVIFPIWPSFLKNMSFFLKHHAKGIYINGQGEFASFNELVTYLLSKLMFRPMMSEKEFEDHTLDFLRGFYGKGYRYIKEYMDLCLDLSNPYFTSFASPTEIIPLPRAKTYLHKGEALLKKARRLAENEGEADRVRKLELTLLYYDVLVFQKAAYRSGDKKLIEEYKAKYQRLYSESLRLGITRIGENVFLPVVKNFLQPIHETFFWEMDGEAYQDRNNESYARNVYLLIPVEGEIGEEKEIEVLCRTNNEGKDGEVRSYLQGAFVSTGIVPSFHLDEEYRPLTLLGTITTAKEISEKFGYPMDGLYLSYVPREEKGIFVEVKMDPGAYIAFKKKDGEEAK